MFCDGIVLNYSTETSMLSWVLCFDSDICPVPAVHSKYTGALVSWGSGIGNIIKSVSWAGQHFGLENIINLVKMSVSSRSTFIFIKKSTRKFNYNETKFEKRKFPLLYYFFFTIFIIEKSSGYLLESSCIHAAVEFFRGSGMIHLKFISRKGNMTNSWTIYATCLRMLLSRIIRNATTFLKLVNSLCGAWKATQICAWNIEMLVAIGNRMQIAFSIWKLQHSKVSTISNKSWCVSFPSKLNKSIWIQTRDKRLSKIVADWNANNFLILFSPWNYFIT